ncbi:MAG: flagellar protein FlgN [Clostridia bacterium]|nr:flagellar protein FlgN [Clostridia bacterium]
MSPSKTDRLRTIRRIYCSEQEDAGLENQMIAELINVLDQENKVYDDILKISKNKTGIIVEGKVAELENIVKLEQALVLQMAKLEGRRESLVDKLSKELKLEPSALSLSELQKHIDSDQAKKLKAVQETMSKTINELKSSNDLNSRLIKNSLDYINFSINILSDAGAGCNNYGNNGQVGDGKKRSFFDVKL